MVVIALNEGKNLQNTVENLEATLPKNHEIVVVDDGSTDGSADFLLRRKGLAKLIRSQQLGTAKARNLGARHTKGSVIVFTDAHMSMEPGWWKPMLEKLK